MPPKQIDYTALAQQLGILPQQIQTVVEDCQSQGYQVIYLDNYFFDSDWLVNIDMPEHQGFLVKPMYFNDFGSGIHYADEADPLLSRGLPLGSCRILPRHTYFGKLAISRTFKLNSLSAEDRAEAQADLRGYFKQQVEDELMSLAFERDLNALGFSAVIDLQQPDSDTVEISAEFFSISEILAYKKTQLLPSIPYKN